ncbi:MAG TPA: hypothetical protein VGM06_22060 [Polyangiaceae bacterium]|jgi:hypothetical protein
MTEWEEHKFESRVRAILKDVAEKSVEHHLGVPFLTAYQLAIEFNRLHPEVAEKLGLQVGGKGIGERVSLAQRLAKMLSQGIKHGKIIGVEGAFLSHAHVTSLVFGGHIESSTEDLAMFRLSGS